MALQSSGQIKFSELNTELGRTSTNLIGLGAAENGDYATINSASSSKPNGSAPSKISEWFSYDHGAASNVNDYYYDMSRDALRRTAVASPFNLSGSQDLSVSFWIKQSATTANEIMWDLSNTSSNSANRFFVQYQYSLNRLIVRYRTGSTNYDRQFALHDNNSVTGTGTNSNTKWSNTNRGNVNADGWSMLTVTYDASQSNSANGIKLYWNANELTTQAANASGSRSTSAVNDITIGNNNHNSTTTGGGLNAAVDEFKIFDSVLSSSNITTLYNSGVPANASATYNTDLVTEFTWETNSLDSAQIFNIQQRNTGTRTAY
jgi:hypothetical protein